MSLADDYAELMNLYARYCHAIDDHDETQIRSCFTPDAVLHVVSANAAGGEDVVSGDDDIAERMIRVAGGRPGFAHVTTNVMLTPSAEGYAGRASFRVLTASAQTESMGRYDDAIVRRPSSDLAFRKRVVTYRWRAETLGGLSPLSSRRRRTAPGP